MYEVNDIVVYGTQGVCRITEIAEKDFVGKKMEYFVLKPIKSETSVYFVPTDNELLVAKMRKILSVEEINRLIDSMADEKANWIADENERKEKYSIIISEGNHTELIKMIKAIFLEKKERESNRKKLHAADERFLKDAEQILYDEFQYVLNLNKDKLMEYIFNRIENK